MMGGPMTRFEELGLLGEGTYGVVKKCRHKATGLIVAIKKFKDCKDGRQKQMINKTAGREVEVLQSLKHVNLVRLLDVFRIGKRLHLVFEFVEGTVLQALEAKPDGLGDLETRKIMWQLVKAVAHLHSLNIVHRDIKPENMLLSSDGMLKLCDFGFARYMSTPHLPRDMSGYVATRWYRAPELLLSDNDYGQKVDIWAIGCMLVEIQTGEPLFAGESDLDQLWVIMKSFTDCQTASLRGKLLLQRMQMPQAHERKPLHQRFRHLDKDALAFLEACLHPHPDFRLSCAELLDMPYFKGAESWFDSSFFSKEGEKAARLHAVTSDRETSQTPLRTRRQRRRNDPRNSSNFASGNVQAALNVSPLRNHRTSFEVDPYNQSIASSNPAQRCSDLRSDYGGCYIDEKEQQAHAMLARCNIGSQQSTERNGQIELAVRAGPNFSNGPLFHHGSPNFTPPSMHTPHEAQNHVLRYQTPTKHERNPGHTGRRGHEFQSPDPRWRAQGRRQNETLDGRHLTPKRSQGHANGTPHPKHSSKRQNTQPGNLSEAKKKEKSNLNHAHNAQPQNPDHNMIPAFYGKQMFGRAQNQSPNIWAQRDTNYQIGEVRHASRPRMTHHAGDHLLEQFTPSNEQLDMSQQGSRMTMTGNPGHNINQSPFRWDSPSRAGDVNMNALMRKLSPSKSPLRAQAPIFVPAAMQMQGKRAELH